MNSCASTISSESSGSVTTGPKSTVQLIVTSDPLITVVPLLLVRPTDSGSGTATR